MSYKIGQLRYNQVSDYTQEFIEANSNIKSFGGTVQDGFITLQKGSFKKDAIYYLPCELRSYYNNSANHGIENMRVRVKLKTNTKEQLIDSFYVKYNRNMPYTFIFQPDDNYDSLVLEVDRTTAPSSLNNNHSYVKVEKFIQKNNKQDCRILNNVLPAGRKVRNFGIQAPPGFTFAANGEKIIVGKSGIYTANGVNVTNLNFILGQNTMPLDDNGNPIITPDKDNLNYFIFDYQYEEGGN